MARGSYVSIPMIVDNVVVGLITTTADVIDRFDIPDAVVSYEIPGENRRRKAHTRKIYASAANEAPTGTVTNVKDVVKVYVPDKNRINAGKKIKLDTGFRSVPPSVTGAAATAENAGSVRYATWNFPNGASNYQIARWLTVNVPAARRPAYFITPSGARRRLNVAAAPGQTTGEGAPDPAP